MYIYIFIHLFTHAHITPDFLIQLCPQHARPDQPQLVSLPAKMCCMYVCMYDVCMMYVFMYDVCL